SGMMKIESEKFSIREKLIEINNMVTLRARDKKRVFEMDIDPALPEYINSDPLRIQHIINNFISNSLKFTETEKITLKIKVVTHVDDQYTIRFTVIDTGIGIKDEAIEKIFLAFEQ